MKRALSGKMLTLMLTCVLALAFNIQRVKAQEVGVKAGNYIRYEYTITGAPSTPLGVPQWARIDFLSVEGAGGTFRIIMHFTEGREYNDTASWSVTSGSINLGSFRGIVIPTNSKIGDIVHMIGGINATIAGETTKMCAGVSRTVIHSSFYEDYQGSQFEYYWDKETGVMVEASVVSSDVTAIVTITETNLWGTSSHPFYLQWWFYVAVAVVVVSLGGVIYLLKKRKRSTSANSPLQGNDVSAKFC